MYWLSTIHQLTKNIGSFNRPFCHETIDYLFVLRIDAYLLLCIESLLKLCLCLALYSNKRTWRAMWALPIFPTKCTGSLWREALSSHSWLWVSHYLKRHHFFIPFPPPIQSLNEVCNCGIWCFLFRFSLRNCAKDLVVHLPFINIGNFQAI